MIQFLIQQITNMLLYAIFLSYITDSFTSYVNLPKCCEVGSAFVEQNNSFFCNQSENRRVVIQEHFGFNFSDAEEYECVEGLDKNLLQIKKTLNKIEVVKDISDYALRKCCPVNHLYDPITHSCEGNLTISSNGFNATFLRIGLPDCRIIYDYELKNLEDVQRDDNTSIKIRGRKYSNEKYCVDETVSSNYVVRVCETFDICESVLCLHKCCPDGQSFVNGSHCRDTFVYGMDLDRFSNFVPNISIEFAVIHGYTTGVYIPKIKNYHIDDQGNFYSFQEKLGNEVYTPEEETYCIEHATKAGRVFGHTLFRIVPQAEYIEKKFLYNRWAMVVSNIFLIITIIYYVFSKETRKVFGKTLVSFCSALFVLFVIIVYCTFKSKLNTRKTMTTCKAIGNIFNNLLQLQLLRLAASDVLRHLLDIRVRYWSSKRYSSFSNKKKRDLKRFICYSLYGWGLPLVMTVILLTFHFSDVLPPSIKIRIGETKCLIERGDGNYADILFYIIPISALETVNVVFFVKTVRYCLQVKGNIQKMSQSVDVKKKNEKFRAKKERFGLVIKLSIIMGIFYLFEVVSSFYDFKKNSIMEHVEIIWDCINCLQGLFIFIIFICKTKFFKKCNRKVAIDKIRKISLTTSTRTTAVSSERKSSRGSRSRKKSKEEAKNHEFG
ncbi:hypothetical protein NQ315_003418 [Exocentrus adspersus]|uniref:G-protein coupled receptors family 2 profile 2 domain-containing protein n=1 Tax=Exocentrus adspersus TaxID=1586481 RepID=A0AAV8VN13_9CUCU|nr:hypothetical protein NQ315_003418 [Exocentrus adspersus]